MKYLLDTNVFTELGKSTPHRNVTAWKLTVDDIDLAISVITVREVTKGIKKLERSKPAQAREIARRTNAAFDAAARILPIDRAVAESWAEALAASGKHAGDTGLAATAKVHGLTLVTRNTKDFAGRDIALLDPFKSPPRRSA